MLLAGEAFQARRERLGLCGRDLDPEATRPAAVAMRRLNETVVHDERVESVMLPVRDGVTLVRKRS